MAFLGNYRDLRWFPTGALVFNIVAFALSLKALVVGLSGSAGAENAAFITYNTSFIGEDLSQYPPDLANNVSALVPNGSGHLPSVTQYLGIADWYSLHYLSICQGSFATDPATNLLTSSKSTIVCTHQSPGYSFYLPDTLSSQLKPEVRGLVNHIPPVNSQDTKPSVALRLLGLILAGINIPVLIFTLHGYRQINVIPFALSVLTQVSLAISSGLATGHSLGVQESNWGWASSEFLAIVWTGVAFEAVALLLINLEWRLERFTPRGQRITRYNKPPEVSSWMDVRKNPGVYKDAQNEEPVIR